MKKALLLILVNCLLLCSSILLAQNRVFAAETTISATPSAENLPTAHILPDNPLYFLKTIKEKVQLFVTRNTASQANLLLDFSQKRLAEAQKVAEKGKIHISEKLFDAFGKDIETAQAKIKEAKARGEQTRDLVLKLQETVARQKLLLEKIPGLDSFLVEIDQSLEATGSGKIQNRSSGKGLGIFDWLRGLFGRKEILKPLAE